MSGLIGRYGSERAVDSRLKLLADCPFSEGFFFEISQEIRPYLRAIKGAVPKVLVLDLDNTLLGGVVGEDGWNSVAIGTDPLGKAYLEFQKSIYDLYKRGTILAINSKNNFEDVQEVFQKRDDMILKLEYFASIRVNWNDKAKNCYEIAKEINVGIDSLVFWDDNPAERMLVHQAIEEVCVIDPPEDISNWAMYVKNMSYFDSLHLGTEDMQRGKMYAENRQRQDAQVAAPDLHSYYHSLSLKVECLEGTEEQLPRIVSLLGRTNQFNLTTKRYTEQEIQTFIEDVQWTVRSYAAEDRFGSYGVVGVAIIAFKENSAILDSLLLSCRAMGKGIEDTMIFDIAVCVREMGIRTLTASYLPTKKNVPIQPFLPGKGFIEIERSGTEIQYSVDLADKKFENPEHIQLIKF
jgi:FkbH-like protein